MGAQTSITQDPPVAYEGQLSEQSGFGVDIISKLSAEANGIAAGLFVIQGTNDDQCKLPSVTGDITGLGLLGVAIFDPSKMTSWPPGAAAVQYPQGQVVAIARRARVWVYTEEAVTPADAPFVRFASGAGGTVIGRVRKTADTATAVAIPTGKARFMTTAGAGSLVLIEVALS